MKTYSSTDKLILQDSPGGFLFIGIFFIALGILSATLSVWMTADPNIQSMQKTLAFAISMCAVAVGLYIIYDAPDSRVTADREAHLVIIRRRGLLRKEFENYLFSEIQEIYTVQQKDIEGASVYSLRMRLLNGKEVALTKLWSHGRAILEENAVGLKSFIAV
jgi:hypothetical protein